MRTGREVNELKENRASSNEDSKSQRRNRENFERFQSLNVRSNDQLEDLVRQCQATVSGVQPQSLRNDQSLRRTVATELSAVQSVLDGLLVDRPRRRILRAPK